MMVDMGDLAGDVTVHVVDESSRPFAVSVIMAEQVLAPTVKYAAWVPVSREVLADAEMLRRVVDTGFDRWLRPWLFPDPNRWPTFTPLPLLARLAAWWQRRTETEDWDDDEW